MNIFDRAVAAVFPQTAVKRAAARRKLEILDSGYSNYGASHTKKGMIGWTYGGGSAKEDIQENLSTLRQRCRDLYMGVPLATGALKTCRTNVVGSGLKLKSQVDYEVLGMTEETSLQTVLIFPSRPQDTSAMKTSSACSGVICISARIVFIESE